MAFQNTPGDEREQLGFGLLGYGFAARIHSNALRTIPYIAWPSKVRPVPIAIAGRTAKAVCEAATRYGYERYTTDWRDLVEDRDIDVFDNVAADSAHVEPTLAALEAGKHVLCEKPLASTARDAQLLYETAEIAGVKHLVGFNYRFFPAVRLGLGAHSHRRPRSTAPGAVSVLVGVAHRPDGRPAIPYWCTQHHRLSCH